MRKSLRQKKRKAEMAKGQRLKNKHRPLVFWAEREKALTKSNGCMSRIFLPQLWPHVARAPTVRVGPCCMLCKMNHLLARNSLQIQLYLWKISLKFICEVYEIFSQ